MTALAKNKTGALVKRGASSIADKPSLEKVREAVKTAVPIDCDPDTILKELRDDVFPRLKKERDSAGRNGGISVRPEDSKKLRAAAFVYATDTHLPLMDTVEERYRPMLMHSVREIEKEYDCKTPTEKMLAEIIAGSHARVMEYGRQLTRGFLIDYLTHENISYIAMFGKEMDRAHRQFLNAVATLKQIKNPPLEVNVTAKTAFVAQNQQINATQPKS